MKRSLFFAAVLFLVGTIASAQEIIKKGDPLSGNSPKLTVTAALEDPKAYENKTVTIEGIGERVCTNKGCWVEVADAKGGPSMRFKIREDKFSLPQTAVGMKVRAEGQLVLRTLTKEQADHFEEEGGKLKRNADGTANEVRLLTTAIEIEKPKA